MSKCIHCTKLTNDYKNVSRTCLDCGKPHSAKTRPIPIKLVCKAISSMYHNERAVKGLEYEGKQVYLDEEDNFYLIGD